MSAAESGVKMTKCCGTCKHLRFDDPNTFHCDLDDDQVSLSCKCDMYGCSIYYLNDVEDDDNER